MKGKYGTSMTTFRAPKLKKIRCNCRDCIQGAKTGNEIFCKTYNEIKNEKFCKYYCNKYQSYSDNNNRKKSNKKSNKKYYRKNYKNNKSKK